MNRGRAEDVCAWCKRSVHTCVAHRSAFHERLRAEEKSEGRGCGEGGFYVNRDGERERERERRKGRAEPRVNRICMETVCQWVASSCGYLTLFTSPPRRTPRLFIATLLNLHLSILFPPLSLSLSVPFFLSTSPFHSAPFLFLSRAFLTLM